MMCLAARARFEIRSAITLSMCVLGCSGRVPRTSGDIPSAAATLAANQETESDSSFLRAFLHEGALYFKIPRNLVNADFLLYQEYLSGDQQVLRWLRHENKLVLIQPEITYAAGSAAPRQATPRRTDIPMVLGVFQIESEDRNGGAVVDVTRLFTKQTPGFLGARRRLDPERTFVEDVENFSSNVEINAVHTHADPPSHEREYVTTRMHWSVVRLPSNTMKPRLYDPRIGYWAESEYSPPRMDYSAAVRASIVRWRLEKKDPTQLVSEAVKPIVFYIDPATPAKWRPWIRKGIEAWRPAFEAAGFRDAIIAKDPPAGESAWSVNDARYSVVRWLTRRQREHDDCAWVCGGGTASTVRDPRTGEILKANAYVSESFDRTARNWYFTMASPLDPRAHTIPFPDSLTGALYQSIVTHEVGHALGLRDGNYGELTYPVDSLRSETWLRRMTFSPSIFNYSRYNYVAQPEDSIPVELLVRSIGPADVYSIQWGYTPIPNAKTADEERPVLESWAQMQDSMPWLRFVTGDHELYTVSDVSDDADPIASAALGMKNLRRVMDILPRATLRPGSDNRLLKQMYEAMLTLWSEEINRVVVMIGGHTVQYKSGSQDGSVYTPLPADRQRASMRFLDTVAFRIPEWLVRPDIARRFEEYGLAERILTKQAVLLGKVLDPARLRRMAEAEATAARGEGVYSGSELLTDVRRSLWSELSEAHVIIDVYRRELQRHHLMLLTSSLKVTKDKTITAHDLEYRTARARPLEQSHAGLMLLQVQRLREDITKAIPRAANSETLGHLQLMRDVASEVL